MQRERRVRQGLVRGALVVLLLVLVTILWGVWRARQPPSWFPPPVGHARSARSLERRMTNDLTATEGAPKRTLSVDAATANAWLTHRLRAWLESRGVQWPEEVGTPRVAFSDDALHLALPWERRVFPWVTLHLSVRPAGEGGARVRWHGARLGRFPVPRDWLLSDGRRLALPDGPAFTAGALRDGVVLAPSLALDERRRATLEAVKLEPGRARVTVRVEGR